MDELRFVNDGKIPHQPAAQQLRLTQLTNLLNDPYDKVYFALIHAPKDFSQADLVNLSIIFEYDDGDGNGHLTGQGRKQKFQPCLSLESGIWSNIRF